MRKLIALMLLVAAMGLTGCKSEKPKPAPAPPANTGGGEAPKPADTPAPPAEPAK
jgi:hypothetical protein